ncbi:MAG: hypothetical protein JO188_22865, partial [Hyphomicrobiales bacterium]|nr:hypothetical protein [Hyphomicrobiales bacterium]
MFNALELPAPKRTRPASVEPWVCDAMGLMRLLSSPLDGLPDALREFVGRRALEAAGAFLVAGSAATA